MRAFIAALLLSTSLQAAPVPPGPRPDPLATPLLGVRESQVLSPSGVVIGTVIRNSAAEKAGIKEGDILVKFGLNSIDSFQKLRETVILYRPGAVIEVEIERDRKKLILKVCLTEMLPDEPVIILEP
jgi:S1-C subfamily serine protease